METELLERHRLLVDAWFACNFNAAEAGRQVGLSPRSAATIASDILMRPDVKRYIEQKRKALADTYDDILAEVISDSVRVLKADAREVVEYHKTCCRHCWGPDFKYQRTKAELHYDYITHQENHADKQFDLKGGAGFNATLDPNPDCPECNGEGVASVKIKDTRNLSPDGQALYGGVEQTKQGIKVNLRSKDQAAALLARIFGMERLSVHLSGRQAQEMTDDELLAFIAKEQLKKGQVNENRTD